MTEDIKFKRDEVADALERLERFTEQHGERCWAGCHRFYGCAGPLSGAAMLRWTLVSVRSCLFMCIGLRSCGLVSVRTKSSQFVCIKVGTCALLRRRSSTFMCVMCAHVH